MMTPADRLRAEARHNRARIEAALAGRPVPGPLFDRPAAPAHATTPSRRAPEDKSRELREVREILASGEWVLHNALGPIDQRRRLASAIAALVDAGEVTSDRLRTTAPDGSRRRYRLTR